MSYSDYIYQERLRDVVDALKTDLDLATAREAALLEACMGDHVEHVVCTLCKRWTRPDETEHHWPNCLLADPDPAAERLLGVVAAAKAAYRDHGPTYRDYTGSDCHVCVNCGRATGERPPNHEEHKDDCAWGLLGAALADMEANRG